MSITIRTTVVLQNSAAADVNDAAKTNKTLDLCIDVLKVVKIVGLVAALL